MTPLDATPEEIEADDLILDAIGTHIDDMSDRLLAGGAIEKTLRRWLTGHAEFPEPESARITLAAMAADLELFTPSMSGRTMVDRHIAANLPGASEDERTALEALGTAQLRLVRIIDREGPDLVRLKDLVTGESLLLLHSDISPLAAGMPSAMRLCRLPSGRHVLISALFGMEEATLDGLMTLVRPDRPLGHGHRIAASLYRDLARRGFRPMPQLTIDLDDVELLDLLAAAEQRLRPVERLAMRWIGGDEADADLVLEARRLASVDNLVDALGCFGQMDGDGPPELRAVYEQIAALQFETIAGHAGAGDTADAFDLVAAQIDGYIASGQMEPGARDLFDRLKSTSSGVEKLVETSATATAEIDRVV